MKLFLQELKNLALILQELARKNLQDMIKILQENYLARSCKISARFFNSCKKSFIFSARLARFNARSCKFAFFLQDDFTGLCNYLGPTLPKQYTSNRNVAKPCCTLCV